MHLILIIAAGILLATVLLPFLGPIVMIADCIGVIALLGYGIISAVVMGMAAVELSKEAVGQGRTAQNPSFKSKKKATPEVSPCLMSIADLLTN